MKRLCLIFVAVAVMAGQSGLSAFQLDSEIVKQTGAKQWQ